MKRASLADRFAFFVKKRKPPVLPWIVGAFFVLGGWCPASGGQESGPQGIRDRYDVIIAGAGTGGWAAAVQAARLGASVLLLEETDWIGGQMNTAGVTSMDEGVRDIRNRGIYREFYNRALKTYAAAGKSVGTCYFKDTSFAVEPRVGQKLLYDFISEINASGPGSITVSLLSKVEKVLRQGDRVCGVEVSMPRAGASPATRSIASSILIDATEYGDLLPLAGARYRIGNSSSDKINPDSKLQKFTWTAVVKEYPGGIPEDLKIKTPPPGYDNPKLRKAFSKIQLEGPDSDVYADPTSWLAVSWFRGMPDTSRADTPGHPTRTHLNISQNDMEARAADCEDPARRQKLSADMRLRTLQLLYYLQNQLGLPWSVADDEGYDSAYNKEQIAQLVAEQPDLKPFERILQFFPPIAYVRESRRMVGEHTLVSSEIDRKSPRAFADVVSINYYPVDLHGSSRPEDIETDLDPDYLHKPGKGTWKERLGPFQLPLGAFIPEKLDGFLAAEKNISQSRVVSAATRLQPSTMLNGQVAGAIAGLSVRYNLPPRKLDAVLVQEALLDAGCSLWFRPIADLLPADPAWKNVQIAVAHGYLDLVDDRFRPGEEISAAALREIVEKNFPSHLDDLPNAPLARAAAAKLIVEWMTEDALRKNP